MRVAFIAAAMLMMAPSACPSSAVLRLEPASAVDRSVPPLSPYRVRTLMVLAPPGTEQGSPVLAELERMLMAAQIQLVSPGIAPAQGTANPAVAGAPAAALSDLQRAMSVARLAGVDAILELVELGYSDAYRPFEQVSDHYEEVRQGAPVESARLVRVTEARFSIRGRLIDARDGRVLMGIDISQGTSRVFEPAKDVELGAWRRREARELTTDTEPRREVAKQQVLQAFVAKLLSAPPAAAPAPGVAPVEVAPEPSPPATATGAVPAPTPAAAPTGEPAPATPGSQGRLP